MVKKLFIAFGILAINIILVVFVFVGELNEIAGLASISGLLLGFAIPCACHKIQDCMDTSMQKSTNGEKYTLETQKALFGAYLDGKEIEISKSSKQESTLTKTEFVQNCFKELLADGQPHKYSEIVDYTKKKSLSTEFCGGIDRTGVVLYIRFLLNGDDAEYVRLSHGLYQKKTPELIFNMKTESQGSSVYSALDDVTEMQKYMKNICNDCCAAFPQIEKNIRGAFKVVDEGFNKCLDGLSFCMADIEDLDFDESNLAQTPEMKL